MGKEENDKGINAAPGEKQEPQDGAKKYALNSNPAANQNIPEKDRSQSTTGDGSEITDGEGG